MREPSASIPDPSVLVGKKYKIYLIAPSWTRYRNMKRALESLDPECLVVWLRRAVWINEWKLKGITIYACPYWKEDQRLMRNVLGYQNYAAQWECRIAEIQEAVFTRIKNHLLAERACELRKGGDAIVTGDSSGTS